MSSEAYYKTVGGGLKLKGVDLKPKKHKKHKKHKKGSKDRDGAGGAGGGELKAEKRGRGDGSDKKEDEVFDQKKGTGRIITSATAVHGQGGTQFMKEMHAGDVMVVNHPTSLKMERRIVKMVLSDVSLAISSPFSTDLISGTTFQYINCGKNVTAADADPSAKRRKTAEEEKLAFGTYASQMEDGERTITYRVKRTGAYGGYKVITEKIAAGASGSREALLNARSKKKSDRMCM